MPEAPAPPTPPPAPPAPPAPPTPPTPAKLADKYDSPEALSKGIAEIRTKLGLAALDEKQPVIGEKGLYKTASEAEVAYKTLESVLGARAPEPPPIELPETVEGVLKAVGVDADSVMKNWSEKGELSKEQYAKFQKAGHSRQVVDSFIAGQQAIAALKQSETNAAVAEAEKNHGGKEQLAVLREWARVNIDKERLDVMNAQLTKDPKFYPKMMQMIAIEHAAKSGSSDSKPLIDGQSRQPLGGASGPEEFAKLHKAWAAGDESAGARIMATPQQTIESWKRQ